MSYQYEFELFYTSFLGGDGWLFGNNGDEQKNYNDKLGRGIGSSC
jgi:hypothetical protein